MKVIVVCTGNVARSPALAHILQEKYPRHTFDSAAVGVRALPGRVMARPMRQILTEEGFGDYAEAHRSQLLADVMDRNYELAVACTPIHVKHLHRIAPDLTSVLCQPVIHDPAFHGEERYRACWELILQAAENFRPMFA